MGVGGCCTRRDVRPCWAGAIARPAFLSWALPAAAVVAATVHRPRTVPVLDGSDSRTSARYRWVQRRLPQNDECEYCGHSIRVQSRCLGRLRSSPYSRFRHRAGSGVPGQNAANSKASWDSSPAHSVPSVTRSGHDHVEWSDPAEAAEMVLLADSLIRQLDRVSAVEPCCGTRSPARASDLPGHQQGAKRTAGGGRRSVSACCSTP